VFDSSRQISTPGRARIRRTHDTQRFRSLTVFMRHNLVFDTLIQPVGKML
jgi:hypothetical protein